MISKIKKNLDEYLGFDSDKLFEDKMIRVFGGAIRDSIADMKINDIDIIAGSQSVNYISSLLTLKGYTLMSSLIGKDITSIYSGLEVISEPHTWIKDNKIVQIIKPRYKNDKITYYKTFTNLISNVDISSCGVSYDGASLYENYPNAISHCLNKHFTINKYATMFSEKRYTHRVHKLQERGWMHLDSNMINLNRDDKIHSLFNEIEFVSEYA